MDYLLENIIDMDKYAFIDRYNFLWDRFRAIRQDCTIQQCYSRRMVRIYEQMARFHIIALCLLHSHEHFQRALNMEQLIKTLGTLQSLYDKFHGLHLLCPNEGEFRAYSMLLNLSRIPIFLKGIHDRPEILACEPIQQALKLYQAISALDYVSFFKSAQSSGVVMFCLLQGHIHFMRERTIELLNVAYKFQPFPVKKIQELLCFNNLSSAAEYLRDFGMCVDFSRAGNNDNPSFRWPGKGLEYSKPKHYPWEWCDNIHQGAFIQNQHSLRFLCVHCPYLLPSSQV
jgi:hypothetical protein